MYSDRIGEVHVEIVCERTHANARPDSHNGRRVWPRVCYRYHDHNVSPRSTTTRNFNRGETHYRVITARRNDVN